MIHLVAFVVSLLLSRHRSALCINALGQAECDMLLLIWRAKSVVRVWVKSTYLAGVDLLERLEHIDDPALNVGLGQT